MSEGRGMRMRMEEDEDGGGFENEYLYQVI